MKKQTILLILAFFIAIITFAQEKKYTTYKVVDNETITSISKKLGITPYDLLKLNPDAKDGIAIDEILIVPNKNYIKSSSLVNTKRKDSIKNGILYHKVKQYETIYSLLKKYKVSKKKFRKLNKLKRKSKISAGQILKFSTNLKDTNLSETNVSDEIVTLNGIKHISYTVKEKETKYSIAVNHGITIVELENLNPHIKEGLKAHDKILIPLQLNEEIKNTTDIEIGQFTTHVVLSQETFFKLTRQYDVTEEELIALNPELKDGLKVGMEIKVPNKLAEDITLQLEKNIIGKQLNMVMMLPFKGKNTLDSFSEKTKESRSLSRISDFYIGAMIALDSLKSKGLSVNMKVVDTNTKKDNIAVSEILKTQDFSNVDVIIGPLYYSNLKQVAAGIKNSNTLIVSPISKKDHNEIKTTNVIQNIPSDKQLQDKILDFIKDNYKDQNIIIIADEDEKIVTKVSEVTTYLKNNNTINEIAVLRLKDGYIKKELFIENIKKDIENWVILVTNANRSTTAVSVDNFGFLNKEYKVTLFALKKGDNFKDTKNSFLNRLQLHYPSANFIDKKDAKVIEFIKKFKNKYTVEPSSFVFKGYDTTYDALLRIASSSEGALQLGRTKRYNSIFSYDKKENCYSNNGIYIVKYNDYQLEEAK